MTTGRIAVAHGQFSGIRWVVLGAPHLNAWFLELIGAHNPNGILIGSAVFCTANHRVSLYCTMGHPSPPQNCPFLCAIWTPSNTWFLGPTQDRNPTGISIGSAVFAGLTTVTDRLTVRQTDSPTDCATRSVTIGHIYVLSTAMRPNNN